MTRAPTQEERWDHDRDLRKHDGPERRCALPVRLFDRVPANLSPAQRERTERDLKRMACMMVHWFADRAFTCPDSLQGTIETYKGIVVANAHNAASREVS